MHKIARDIKSSVQIYPSSVHVSHVFWIAALIWVEGKVLFNQKKLSS